MIFGYLIFTTVRGQKIGFNACECIKFLNIANFHAFYVWGKRILSCNDTTFFLHFFSFFFAFATQLFSTSVTSLDLRKLRYLRSSGFYRAPLFSFLNMICKIVVL